MAQATVTKATLHIAFYDGEKDGKPVTKATNYNKLNAAAATQEIYDVAQALSSLSTKDVSRIYTVTTTDLTE